MSVANASRRGGGGEDETRVFEEGKKRKSKASEKNEKRKNETRLEKPRLLRLNSTTSLSLHQGQRETLRQTHEPVWW
jgi:hypothetical protein